MDAQISCCICDGPMFHLGVDHSDVYECGCCGNVAEVTSGRHVAEQWRDRSRLPEMDIVDAWNDSIEIYDHSFDAEEARYHHPSRIALLCKQTDLVTAIDVPTARYQAKEACVRAMVRVGTDSANIAELCNESGIKTDTLRQIVEQLDRAESGADSASDASASGRNQHSDSAP